MSKSAYKNSPGRRDREYWLLYLIVFGLAFADILFGDDQHGLIYRWVSWIYTHKEIIKAWYSDPATLTISGICAILAAIVTLVSIRLVTTLYYAAVGALRIAPGCIVAGYRQDSLLNGLAKIPMILRFIDRCMHTLIVGPTRSGKTTLIEAFAEQDFREGHTVFFLDVGGDGGDWVLKAARRIGVPVSIFDPDDPDANKWNLLQPGPGRSIDDVAEDIAAMLEVVSVSSDSYYETLNTSIARNMVYVADAIARKRNEVLHPSLWRRCIDDHEYLLRELDLYEDPYKRLRVGLENLKPGTRMWLENRYLTWSRELRDRNTSGLSLLFDEILSRDSVVEAVCPLLGEKTINMDNVLLKGGLVMFRARPDQLGRIPALVLALMILQSFQQTTLNPRRERRPIAAYFDEIHTILGGQYTEAARSFAHFMTQVGKYGVAVHIAIQGFKLLPDYLLRVVVQNASNKFMTGRLAVEDAYATQQLLGTETTQAEEVRRTVSSGLSSPRRVSTTSRTEEQPRYSVEWIRRLPRGKWLCQVVRDGNLMDPVVMTPRKSARLKQRKRAKRPIQRGG